MIEDKPLIGEQPFFTDTLENVLKEDPMAGLMGIDWDKSRYPFLFRHRTRLVERFNRHFFYREVGAETLSRWQHMVKDKFDEIAPRYNHAYSLYDDGNINLDNLTINYKRKVNYNNDSSGIYNNRSSSEAEADSKFKDTPTSVKSTINNPTTEQVDTDNQKSNSDGRSTNNSNGYTTEEYEQNDKYVIEITNKIIDMYKNIDEEFIFEFNQLFMGIITVM